MSMRLAAATADVAASGPPARSNDTTAHARRDKALAVARGCMTRNDAVAARGRRCDGVWTVDSGRRELATR
jgi:uncharacterized membrane protein